MVPEAGTVVRDGRRIETEQGRKAGETYPWRSVVEVRRYAAHVPQTLRIEFEKGPPETLQWPEGERWHRYTFERPVKVVSAQLDPKREILLDLNKLDDLCTRERQPAASRRWTLEFKAWAELAYAMLESL
jgi:hypothetical protein